jgi:hypothetical protein
MRSPVELCEGRGDPGSVTIASDRKEVEMLLVLLVLLFLLILFGGWGYRSRY